MSIFVLAFSQKKTYGTRRFLAPSSWSKQIITYFNTSCKLKRLKVPEIAGNISWEISRGSGALLICLLKLCQKLSSSKLSWSVTSWNVITNYHKRLKKTPCQSKFNKVSFLFKDGFPLFNTNTAYFLCIFTVLYIFLYITSVWWPSLPLFPRIFIGLIYSCTFIFIFIADWQISQILWLAMANAQDGKDT